MRLSLLTPRSFTSFQNDHIGRQARAGLSTHFVAVVPMLPQDLVESRDEAPEDCVGLLLLLAVFALVCSCDHRSFSF